LPVTDLTGIELTAYTADVQAPGDLDEFWTTTLAEARAQAAPPRLEPVDSGLALVDTFDVTFSGYGGQPVKGWLHVPAGASEQLPLVVRYHGYGGGRGLSHQVDVWALAGLASLQVDTRGQGSAWTPGDTADPEGSSPAFPGFLTRGVLDPRTYYYRRVYTDAVLAVDAARSLTQVDGSRVVVMGGSQGGGISLAVAGLVPDLLGVMADVPFLCDFRRGSEIADRAPYTELAGYLKIHRDHVEQVFSTLAYFDGVVMAARANAPALFSVALMDGICPPSTVYAAFNAYGGPKEMRVYSYNDHEGGQAFQEAAQLAWLRQALA
jgi:cephalosporin-C deacetylase